MRNAVLFANARENEADVACAVCISFNMHALVTTTELAASVRSNFFYNISVLTIESNETF
jgi:hypothetical protein